uniref:Putative kunitz-type serine protease inhibitor n=1 Tax=Amblyomma parvum TaxID=251391 RepID=A0A023G0X2_AMBPA
MKLLAIVFLWCFNGSSPGVGTGVAATEPVKWPQTRGVCELKERLVGKNCGRPFHERRYFYNQTINKCVLFIPLTCGETDEGNNFSTRKDCMKLCMRGSPCLKTNIKNRNGTVTKYTYYPKLDMCISWKYKAGAKLWPERNIFETPEKCREECAPELPIGPQYPGK